jgi:hypothetical protein
MVLLAHFFGVPSSAALNYVLDRKAYEKLTGRTGFSNGMDLAILDSVFRDCV